MIIGKHFRQMLDKFLESPVSQHARVQVQLPNGEMMDILEISLLENTLLGSNETHRLVFKCGKSIHPMGKIIGKL
tara:strand:+ start:299 stop:523 length:225 start_codon:yes stop_codon:yes gene_type:complete